MSVQPYEYSVLRAVPRVERGEYVNVGVVLYCQQLDFLGCTTQMDAVRVRALDPTADVEGIEALLGAIAKVCCGGPDSGPAGQDTLGRRFRWLIAPRSTVVQPGPVHTGLTADPAAALDRVAGSVLGLKSAAVPSL
ncbi:DUF3037 domain-containing protein [Catenulispora sp. NL8]|uniref:DUF3037 domain-containing protein n=1 Tax=Catenulispora pinistramenti TaxID=2705254 RepID=A0ABS5KJC6_9ACTN|nr:DUF3037 domain-containing protein [Catenulispora pinistramenti]MBS2546025.1 DUF3037 domain-containing protein [Catenulispora pinistramenti]